MKFVVISLLSIVITILYFLAYLYGEYKLAVLLDSKGLYFSTVALSLYMFGMFSAFRSAGRDNGNIVFRFSAGFANGVILALLAIILILVVVIFIAWVAKSFGQGVL
ncbi:hypothetical protein LRP50_08525 [Enterovibrio sp. ZSDZ42]|uniref:Uncharacterized protein n=1 Tax=Enterovibrio gelatinilyticus TaxID=2899819 RepID=A0ABT5R0W4_9GAMM|nr:hypothetical protein [Enterovibrio sp. ZSDZ42]MDD1793167.1 hypothetical protein [Enterovibrio sp. ZSDZ42]